MPTYEYACSDCGHEMEVVHGFSDKPPRKCPNCGKLSLRKVFHPVGIVLKGTGFYKTDSRPVTKSGEPKSDGGTESAAAGGVPAESGAGSKAKDTSSTSSKSEPKSA
jgi:putative FmdB family regulatory protein